VVALDEEKSIGIAPKKPAANLAAFSIPDGGWRAWSVVFGSTLALFVSFGYVNAFGVYQSYYSTTLTGRSDSSISWIGSFQLFMQFAMSAVAGKLFDEGYCSHMLAGGSLVYVFSLFMLSLCTEYWQIFLAQGFVIGLGLSFIFLPATSVISHWFQKKRIFAVGIITAGSSVGGVVFPIMLNKLIKSIGFPSAVRATAYLITGCLVLSNILVKPRLPPPKQRPVEMQLPKPDMKRIMTHTPYYFAMAGSFLITWGFFLPFFYLQVYAENKGIGGDVLPFYSLAILNGASIFGRLLPNFVADKLGPYNMIIPFSFLSGMMILVWLAVENTAGLIVFALLYGFFSGSYISLLPNVMMSLAFNVGEIGTRVGIAYLVIAFAGLSGTPIAGALLGSDYMWWKPIIFAGISVLTATIMFIIARHLHAKEKGTWKV